MTRMFISSSTVQQYGNIVRNVITSSEISQRCAFKPSQPETTSHYSDSLERCVCVRYLHCGDVLAGEGVGSVADEQACFTHSPGIRNERKKVIWEITDIELAAAAPTLGMLFTA